MKTTLICMVAATAVISSGCNGDTVKVYNVPTSEASKVQPAVPAAPVAQAIPQAAPAKAIAALTPDGAQAAPFKYTLPAGWKEAPAGEMRVASFLAANPAGHPTDVGVIPMPTSMQQVQLVNMWRQQLQLSTISSAESDKLGADVMIDGAPGKIYDIVSDAKLVDNKSRARILVAVSARGPMNWFFKMVGEESFVEAQKSAFLAFLQSVSFGGLPTPSTMDLSHLPASHPAIPGLNPSVNSLPQGDDSSKPTWNVPADWQASPVTQFSVAKYETKAGSGAKAEISVSALGGNGGGLLPNANRWRSSLGLKKVDQAGLEKLLKTVPASGAQASVVDFTGTDLASGDAAELMVVAVPIGGQTWFYKLNGDAGVVTRQKDAFMKFVQSAKYPDANN